jgi:hypothetical protein
MTPTARTLALLRREGYIAAVVERWLPVANVRRDLFDCIDVLGVKPGEPTIGVQATTAGHVAHRLAKAKALPQLRTWLACGHVFEVWGWALRAGRWTVRRVAVRGEELQAVEMAPRPRPLRARRGERQGGLFDNEIVPDDERDSPRSGANARR